MRHFCTAGPVKANIHYTIPPLERIDSKQIVELIDQQKYFVMHAPRQTGKTSALLALISELNSSGRYRALYVNVESAQASREDVAGAVRSILTQLANSALYDLKDDSISKTWVSAFEDSGPDALTTVLSAWCAASPLPVCLMIDEIDALIGDTLISVLRQLRAGYAARPGRFPQSVILCGVRDVRDHRIHGTKEVITGGSAFNIKAESLRIGDFSEQDIRCLYEQHSSETGQTFDEEIYPLVWGLTRGQPWLVNALAYEACFRIRTDRSQPVTAEAILEAKENLIAKRVTHLDQLTDKLKEPRLQRVIQPILQGADTETGLADSDDAQYAIDLGLVRRGRSGLEVANGIYKEVIPRALNFRMEEVFAPHTETVWYVGVKWAPRHDQAACGISAILPRKLGSVARAFRVSRGGSATVAPGVAAANRERRRTHRSRVCPRAQAHGSAHRLESPGRRAAGGDRDQDVARGRRQDRARRDRANSGVR